MKTKLILLILLPLIAVILALSLYKSGGSGSTFVDIAVAPGGSELKLDGKGVKAGKVLVSAGEHRVSATHYGFAGQAKDFSVSLNETRFVGIVLVPNSPDTKDWYKTHPMDQQMAESIASRNFDQGSADIKQRYPVVSELPFIDQLYRVDYGVPQRATNDPTAIALYVTYYSQDGKKQALTWLKFKGVDIDRTEIVYVNKSP